MRKGRNFLVIWLIISILIGLPAGVTKKIWDDAHAPVKEITASDYRQMLKKDVADIDCKTRPNPIMGDLPEGITFEKEGEEIIAVFLIDKSGSMQTRHEDKLSNVKRAISNSLQYIGTNSYVGLISYSSDIVINVPIAKFDEEQAKKINGELYNIKAVEDTHMYEALAVAMELVEEARYSHENAKVMIFMISDGVPSEDAKTIEFVEKYVRGLSIPVHTIGYGDEVDREELKKLSAINEAIYTFVDSDDVEYEIAELIRNTF